MPVEKGFARPSWKKSVDSAKKKAADKAAKKAAKPAAKKSAAKGFTRPEKPARKARRPLVASERKPSIAENDRKIMRCFLAEMVMVMAEKVSATDYREAAGKLAGSREDKVFAQKRGYMRALEEKPDLVTDLLDSAASYLVNSKKYRELNSQISLLNQQHYERPQDLNAGLRKSLFEVMKNLSGDSITPLIPAMDKATIMRSDIMRESILGKLERLDATSQGCPYTKRLQSSMKNKRKKKDSE